MEDDMLTLNIRSIKFAFNRIIVCVYFMRVHMISIHQLPPKRMPPNTHTHEKCVQFHKMSTRITEAYRMAVLKFSFVNFVRFWTGDVSETRTNKIFSYIFYHSERLNENLLNYSKVLGVVFRRACSKSSMVWFSPQAYDFSSVFRNEHGSII